MIEAPVSAGDLVDRISILEIKKARLRNAVQRQNVERELQCLRARWPDRFGDVTIDQLYRELASINLQLWNIEDEIRDCERRMDFSARFVDLARSVYLRNDRRAELKRMINEAARSPIVEEKVYTKY